MVTLLGEEIGSRGNKKPGKALQGNQFSCIAFWALKKANLVSESSILLPGIGTHKHQINYSMNFKLPLTERRACSAPSHQGRYNFTRPDSQRMWSWEEILQKNFLFLIHQQPQWSYFYIIYHCSCSWLLSYFWKYIFGCYQKQVQLIKIKLWNQAALGWNLSLLPIWPSASHSHTHNFCFHSC